MYDWDNVDPDPEDYFIELKNNDLLYLYFRSDYKKTAPFNENVKLTSHEKRADEWHYKYSKQNWKLCKKSRKIKLSVRGMKALRKSRGMKRRAKNGQLPNGYYYL